MKPKLAIIGVKGYPGYGGSARANSQLVKRLKNKYNITIYAVSSHADENNDDSIKQIVFRRYSSMKLTMVLYYIKSLFHCLFFGKYDLVHAYHNISGFLIPWLRLRYPVLFNIRALEFDQEKKWSVIERAIINSSMIIALKFSSIIATVDRSSIEVAERYTDKEIVYIPNGVENYLTLLDLKAKKKPEYDITFSANRIIYMKGLHLLFEAVKNSEKEYHIQVIGNLNHIESYKKDLLEASSQLNCDFKGLIVDQKTLFESIINSKLFVFPSYLEGMSNQLLEVASLNIPIIASDIPQNTAVFDSSEVLYFKSGNSIDLLDKIEFALQNYEIMQKKSTSAFKKVNEFHNWDDISSEYESLYSAMLGKI